MKQRTLFDECPESEMRGGLNTGKIILKQPDSSTQLTKAAGLFALDVATVTGFCSTTASGTWNFTPKKDESKGMRLIRFKAKLRDMAELERVTLIVFEQATVYGKYPNMVGIEMIGVLKLWCEENHVEYKSYAPTEIKKFGTGKGNAGKDKMVEAVQTIKPGVTDDNEADAIFLYHLAKTDLGL